MISNLFKSLRLTIAFCLFFSVFYIFVLWLFAQVAGPNKGNAELVTLNGKVVGAANVGQNFTQDIYFWGRPSHAGDGYDASSSAGNVPASDKDFVSKEEREVLRTKAASPISISTFPESPISMSLSTSSSIEQATANSIKQILEIIVFIFMSLYFIRLTYSSLFRI